MNILENIIGYVILSILLVVTIAYIGGIMNMAYIAQNNYEATGILEESERTLKYNLESIIVDKNKVDYQVELKDKFLTESFSGLGVSLGSNVKEGMEFRCYNYHLDNKQLNIYKSVDTNNDVEFLGDYYRTDADGSLEGTEYLNIICMYNTYEYIGSTNIIDTTRSPINYVLYSFYKDLKFTKKIIEKKGTLYFN